MHATRTFVAKMNFNFSTDSLLVNSFPLFARCSKVVMSICIASSALSSVRAAAVGAFEDEAKFFAMLSDSIDNLASIKLSKNIDMSALDGELKRKLKQTMKKEKGD